MNLPKNALIETIGESDQPRIERVLWVDPNNQYLIMINVDHPKALPEVLRMSELEDAIMCGRARLASVDPYMAQSFVEEISDKEIAFRDTVWDQIKNVVTREPDIYYRSIRGELLEDILKSGTMSKNTLYKHLRRYWIGGKTKNALLPWYYRNGGKGKKRVPTVKKLGRPRKYGETAGIRIDADIKKIFHAAAVLFLKNKQDVSFVAAYDAMLERFFSTVEYDTADIPQVRILPEDRRPTLNQFRYWFANEYDAEDSLVFLKGRRKYEMIARPVLKHSQNDVAGPGSVFQVDATIADIYLVSSINRNNIIGRPIVYMIVDVFSRMVTGLYVGLEGPSWLGFSMALQNAFSDKVSFCEQYDVGINREDWPCAHLPEALLGDRGEAISKNSEMLANVLGIRIDNTPPYRADLKGIIERMFKTVDVEYISRLPGHIKSDIHARGGKDYRLDAKLTINEFTSIMIRLILDYNHNRVLSHDMLDKDMMGANVKPRPLDLWNWGTENRSGILKTASEELIKLALMPSDKASVTERGVRYKNLYYTSLFAQSERWFTQARSKGRFKINIAYDPRNKDVIYYKGESGRECIEFAMVSGEKFGHCTYDEIMYQQELELVQTIKLKEEQRQKKASYNLAVSEILKEATQQTNGQQDPSVSKSKKIKGIRENRRVEKELRRKHESFHTTKSKDNTIRPVEPVSDSEQAPTISSNRTAANIDLFRKIQKERIHGDKK